MSFKIGDGDCGWEWHLDDGYSTWEECCGINRLKCLRKPTKDGASDGDVPTDTTTAGNRDANASSTRSRDDGIRGGGGRGRESGRDCIRSNCVRLSQRRRGDACFGHDG